MPNDHTLQLSELRYRRVFEAAKDGILILNADTGAVEDANPFMTELLGYAHDQFCGETPLGDWPVQRHRAKQGRFS
jgi:PAS domain S-box-containing protein